MEQHKYYPPNFPFFSTYKRHDAGDQRKDEQGNTRDVRERVAKLRIDLRDLKLFPLQRERFVYLLGPRYNAQRPHDIKIVCKQYETFQENYIRAHETLREIYWESLRAP